MQFPNPLIEARLIKRYKRFLADCELATGELVTATCPNTGSMMGCADAGIRIWLAHAPSPTRKYEYTWELSEPRAGVLVGINTGYPNKLVERAIGSGVIKELAGYTNLRREVKYGDEASRIDLLLEHPRKKPCYVEVKNVTAAVENGIALFPDAVSERGAKHLREMMREVEAGNRAVLVFCVQREDVTEVRPADEIDPVYGQTLREAIARGVEVIAYRAKLSREAIALEKAIPVLCP